MKSRISVLKNHTDAELTKLIYEGDYEAFDVLIKRHSAMLSLFLYWFVRNRQNVQDVAQNTWMLVMAEFEKKRYKETGKFKSWLRIIAKREALRWMKIERHQGMVMATAKMSEENTVMISNMHDIGNPRMARALKTLPPQMQTIIDLHFFKHMTFREIAKEFHLSVGAVTNAYSRALKKMREGMEY